ncbi:unnamed protein product, partial [Aphanomyces euteiches]
AVSRQDNELEPANSFVKKTSKSNGQEIGIEVHKEGSLAESLRGMRTLLTMTEKVNNGLRDMVAVSSRMLEEGKAIQGNLETESASRSTDK